MIPLKLRIKNQFGASEFLGGADDISVHFPYEPSSSLVKRMSYGAVKILNAEAGEISVQLSDFEVQGLPLGEKQNIAVRIHVGSKTKEAIFPKCLNVRTIHIGDESRKVIHR